MYTRLFVLMTLFWGIPYFVDANEPTFEGKWVGFIEWPGAKLPLALHLSTGKKDVVGAIDLPSEGIADQAVEVKIRKNELTLNLKMENGGMVLKGQITGHEISGRNNRERN